MVLLRATSTEEGQCAPIRWIFANASSAIGCVATFKKRQERVWSSRPGFVSCRHFEQLVDELNLSPNVRTAHPPRLSFPHHVHGLVALDGSPRRVKLAKRMCCNFGQRRAW